MQVVLQKAVPTLGQAGELVKVSDAYARNFLLPKKLAVVATASLLVRTQAAATRQKQEQSALLAERQRTSQRLVGARITLTGRASASGRLFAAVKAPAVRQALAQQYHLGLGDIELEPDHFKTIGEHQAVLRWAGQPPVTIIIRIAHV